MAYSALLVQGPISLKDPIIAHGIFLNDRSEFADPDPFLFERQIQFKDMEFSGIYMAQVENAATAHCEKSRDAGVLVIEVCHFADLCYLAHIADQELQQVDHVRPVVQQPLAVIAGPCQKVP